VKARGRRSLVEVAREKTIKSSKLLGYESYRGEDESYHHVATVGDAWMLLGYELFLINSKILLEGSRKRGRAG
jgi:hypothetical protein